MKNRHQIQMVVLDWAGTTVDYGSSAPGRVFEKVFREAGVLLDREEINRPMGMEKKAHIRALLSGGAGNRQWKESHGRDWTEEDVETLYQRFEEQLHEIVAEYSVPIAGTVEAVEELRQKGIRIGSTTGYTSQMMEQVIPRAAELGYRPDCVVTPDVTGSGRPGPFMLFECMRQMEVYPPCAVVKAGDTVVDIQEGKNAGAWSVGILTGSNLVGLTEEEAAAMAPDELERRREKAAEAYRKAGADLVIGSIRELPEAVEKINSWMAGEEAHHESLL